MATGSQNDFERTALPHADAVYRTAVALCGRADLAEDLAQTTMLKALERFDSFKAGTNCKAWLMRILRNTWIDRLRKKRPVSPSSPVEELDVAARPAVEVVLRDDVLENFSDRRVIEALSRLGDEQRLALVLVDVEELSYDEAAGVLDIPPGTVKSRISRARAALRDRLKAHAKELGFDGRKS